MAAFAFRFTFGKRSLVVSGDTAKCDALVPFARGADVFVVNACAFIPPGDYRDRQATDTHASANTSSACGPSRSGSERTGTREHCLECNTYLFYRADFSSVPLRNASNARLYMSTDRSMLRSLMLARADDPIRCRSALSPSSATRRSASAW